MGQTLLDQVTAALAAGEEALRYAREVRELHRRRRAPDRIADLTNALQLLASAMALVRPHVHRAVRRPVPHTAELRATSEAIQRERRKVRKMIAADGRRTDLIAGLDAGWV